VIFFRWAFFFLFCRLIWHFFCNLFSEKQRQTTKE
jgi:hypothetical protein